MAQEELVVLAVVVMVKIIRVASVMAQSILVVVLAVLELMEPQIVAATAVAVLLFCATQTQRQSPSAQV